VSTSSNLFKETLAFNVNTTLQQLFTVPGFQNEYDFSKLKMHERLIAFGVGTGAGYSTDAAENQGMTDFLGICTNYWNELDSLGVGPTAQAAFSTWKKYIRQVAQLAKSNDEWWQMFRGTYPLSKFGFTTKWKETSSPDIQGLFWGEEDMPDETETSWYE